MQIARRLDARKNPFNEDHGGFLLSYSVFKRSGDRLA
jgi:hypothetical protein